MSNQTTTTVPNIEKLHVQEAAITLAADMTLAMIPVTVYGQYNINSNCYYPSHLTIRTDLEDQYSDGDEADLEEFCEKMGWDYFDTHDLIQGAVEKRDQ